MQLLGVTASHGAGARSGGDFESISTVTVGSGGASTITFSSIPATYAHLQIRWISRVTASYTNLSIGMRFNSDSGNNYTYHTLNGNGSSVYAGGATAYNYAYFDFSAGANASSNVFGNGVTDILDYANTNKYTTLRNLGGVDNNGSGAIVINSAGWYSTAAISDIVIYPVSGNFAQYTSFALYGLKGA